MPIYLNENNVEKWDRVEDIPELLQRGKIEKLEKVCLIPYEYKPTGLSRIRTINRDWLEHALYRKAGIIKRVYIHSTYWVGVKMALISKPTIAIVDKYISNLMQYGVANPMSYAMYIARDSQIVEAYFAKHGSGSWEATTKFTEWLGTNYKKYMYVEHKANSCHVMAMDLQAALYDYE